MHPDPFVVLATFQIKEGQQEVFKASLLELGVKACLESEPDCLTLWAHQDTENSTKFMLYEHWTNRRSFEASFASPWRDIYAEATEHLWEVPRVTTTWQLAERAADGQ